MREGHPFSATTPDFDPGFCPVCYRRIDRSSVRAENGWVDFECSACGEVRLDLTKHRERRGFSEHLETALSQYDRSSGLGEGRSFDLADAAAFRTRMSDFIVARRAAIADGGRIAVSGSFEPTGPGGIQVGGLPGISTFDLIVEGGRPPNVTVVTPLK